MQSWEQLCVAEVAGHVIQVVLHIAQLRVRPHAAEGGHLLQRLGWHSHRPERRGSHHAI